MSGTGSSQPPAPDPANLERLARMLERADARQLGLGDSDESKFPFDPRRPEELAEGGNFRLVTNEGVLDIMQWIPGISDEQAYDTLAADAVEGRAFGVSLKVCSLEHLRTMKRAAGRPQDEQDLANLAAAHPEAEG